MAGACLLARHGLGQVHPNPLVGAVVLRGEEWIGRGWHAELGAPHAEVMALAEAGDRARGATLVVTLEPCAHHGRTPPCVDAIIAAGIARVVIGAEDPNPVARGGAERLRAAGIAVETGLLADQVRRQNFRFFHSHRSTGMPWVTVKLAVSLDGRIADAAGAARWLSSAESREWVHRVRAEYAAIGAGAATVIADDARLTVRGSITPRVPPTRVVFDRSGRLTGGEGIFHDAADVPVIVIRNSQLAPTPGLETREGVTVLHADTLEAALRQLAAHGVDALLVEGGGRLAGALWREGLIDRVHQVVAPLWLGDGVPAWAGLGAPSIVDARRWTLTEARVADGDAILTLERP
ncbi:MAG TPA: bifunctional diaminohydroxyphosphoribosylaminopyrimidine deaminase/5-amino-6-(5-phosphoribosylamino)uracil reductase RibD [Gemmatimonadales bacterium]|nr:bifunctional diaminohydroxyphosphoribosylaminopyrimidine deaminase/5-amino-6-(5-phosphoribosylamino)uracil reductase RibD [Gemmatimonadales bacterium]HRX18376.1 bifunctional diaminohydroxyphosphoribosylaminopyrimidine deaminase/5-amino-6-(5-phosphoribosylamino)uracil reductase RibD [Gemmatimonadales bacterium]